MAYASSLHLSRRPGLAEWIRATVTGWAEARAKRALYLKTLDELERLTDRELDDLDISRLSIRDIARAHAYGA